MTLQGRFVTLRPLTVEDAKITLRWRQSPRARFLQRGAQTLEEQRAWISSKQNSREFNWIIEYKGTQVGMEALHDISLQNRSAIIGRLLIGEKVGNAPVAFEAELLLCDFAYGQLGLHKIYGPVLEDNIGIIRFRNYLGYKQDGILRDHYFHDGVFKNGIMFSLLEDEYRMVCRPKLVQLIALLSRFGPCSSDQE